MISPSTLPGTRTALDVRHELVMKLHFVYPEEEEARDEDDSNSSREPPYALCVTQPITVSSVSMLFFVSFIQHKLCVAGMERF